MRRLSFLGLVALLGLTFSWQAFAASPPRSFAEERFVINAGALFAQNIDTRLSATGSDGVGDSVTLEEIFGFSDSETVFFVNGYWRFANSRKHRIGIGYSAINRSNAAIISEEIEIGDTIYPVDARVRVEFDVSLMPVSYAYSFVLSDKTEFAGIVGLHWVSSSFGVGITALAPTKGVVAGVERGDVSGPFPNFGLELRHAFTPNWRGHGEIRYFDIEIDDFDGSLTDAGFGMTYMFNHTFGLDLAWRWFDMEVGVSSADWRGGVKYKFNGPIVTANFNFGN